MLDASTHQSLVKDRISPEQEILLRHFAYFGPVSEGLLQRIDSEVWATALKGASRGAEMAVKDEPGRRFEVWGQHFGLEAQSMISGMTAIDPATRITIDRVLAHRWWQETTCYISFLMKDEWNMKSRRTLTLVKARKRGKLLSAKLFPAMLRLHHQQKLKTWVYLTTLTVSTAFSCGYARTVCSTMR